MAEPLLDGIEKILLNVKGTHSLDKNTCNEIVKALDNNPKPQSIQKLLSICIQDPKNDVKYATETLNIVSSILRKVTAEEFTPTPDLFPSMLEILRMLNTSIYSCQLDEIKVLYFKILISYPDKVYVMLEDGNEVLELFNLYVHQRMPIELRVQPINVLHKYLKVLSPERKLAFVEQGMNIWLRKLVSCIMLFVKTPDFQIETSLATLEMIVDEFIHIDYSDNPNLQFIVQGFYGSRKYSSMLNVLLAQGNKFWARIWIVFIKIFKNQLTKSSSSGSPINSLLPVVETAFKLDVTNRCYAFQCWNALIDNFATETNEAYINKRIKLLVIPLYSNNAKVEEIVIAKIYTWWHLIRNYYSKLDSFADVILIPFLQFCFGNPLDASKTLPIPGSLTDKTKEQCVEAFVNIFGHHDCDGCVSLPTLREPVIDEKCLLASQDNLIHCHSAAINIVTKCPSRLRQPYKCAWTSFIKLICDIKNDHTKRDLFNKLLIMIEILIQDTHNENLTDVVLNDLLLTLFKGDDQIYQLLISEEGQNSPVHKIWSIIVNPLFDSMYNRNDMHKAVETFKPLAECIVENCYSTSIIDAFLNQLSANYNSFILWSAMSSSVCEKYFGTCPEVLSKMLYWPFKHFDLFTTHEFSTSQWLNLLDFVYTKLGQTSISNDVFKAFYDSEIINPTNSSLFLNGAIMLLTRKLNEYSEGIELEKELQLVYDISAKILDLNHTHPIFMKLIDILLQLFKKLLKDINIDIAKHALMILQIVFMVLHSEIKKSLNIGEAILLKVEQLLKSLEDLLKLEAYESLKEIVLPKFLEYASEFGQQPLLKVTIVAILDMFLKSMSNDNVYLNTVKYLNTTLKEERNPIVNVDKPKFTTPATKKVKKKEPSIVNTVVEDGERFAVIKSNWKFNPKKLTDNQKEKLKRKREDIPALYQDLSQSQEEFNLNTWKTDSQDTNTTTTSSKSNELTTCEKELSSILKNMPNTDVVPKILKNILIEPKEQINSSIESTNDNVNEVQSPVNKEVKPRLSLKDRVFRNVRILIEKSDITSDTNNGNQSIVASTPPLTPPGMTIKNSDIHSAPFEINSDRPSRVKRKPKKFEEMQIFAIKKRRNSLSNNDSQKDSCEDLNHSQDVRENFKPDESKLNSSDTKLDIDKCQEHVIESMSNVSEYQENQNTQAPNLGEAEINHNFDQTKDILNMDQKTFTQNKDVDDEQQSSKLNGVTPTSQNHIEKSISIDNSTITTPTKNQINNDQPDTSADTSIPKCSIKKTGKKKSRIEKELAIDTVEGHPFLKAQSEKRITRKKALESAVISRRKSLIQKLNKPKLDQKNTPKAEKKFKEIEQPLDKSKELSTFPESQESKFQDESGSQDIIESSQDSTVSIMSVKSSKIAKRISVATAENVDHKTLLDKTNLSDKDLSADSKNVEEVIINNENDDDSEFPLNKTAIDYVPIDLTENCDTESIHDNDITEIDSNEESAIAVNLDNTCIGTETQDVADADTQPMDSNSIITLETITPNDKNFDAEKFQEQAIEPMNNVDTTTVQTQDETTRSVTDSLLCITETKADESSAILPSKDAEQRKQDFLNNTLEISPIKTLSPVRENKSPSPETSSDYVVIKLSSPVQSNGEPFEKCDSPEIFTEEKVSPDKRDLSPPREEIRGVSASPRSLSLKKNKPQVRSGRRAAQMLGLCIPGPDRLQTILNSENSLEPEEPKKSSPLNSSAKRNLRILYSTTNETSETSDEIEEGNHFLKMKRSLPAADSSPSVPILKRKLADIVDDTTVSPANKRKRVSFHDPPVSTTVCVKKYIEASSVRSPQNSASKRLEKQSRSQGGGKLKSQKRLDTVFKLDTALTKAVESFSENDMTPNATGDTEMSSLEPTPLVEVVKNSDLNDVDPICLELVNCQDPIDNIAGDLSSSAMRPLLVKEFAGKIETVGDLAKMTELEVNRLCIKAPKVQVVKKVLSEYAKKVNIVESEMTPMTEAAFSDATVHESKAVDVEMQTESVAMGSVEVQTEALTMSVASSQTSTVSTVDCEMQTDETNKSTAEIVISLLEKPDFCDRLKESLDVPSKQSIATSLPPNVLADIVLQEVAASNSTNEIIDRLLEKHTSEFIMGRNDNPRLSFMRDYLSERFSSKDLILLCSDLLKKTYDNME